MDWSDVLKLALSIFLIATGLGLAYLFLRMAGVFGRLGVSVTRLTDEVVPILNKAQTTVDGVNLELARVDEIMKTAVGATKGAEKTVQTVSSAVTTPVRKLTGFAAGAREAVATLRARRAADAADRAGPPPGDGPQGGPPPPPPLPPPVDLPPPVETPAPPPAPGDARSGTTRPTAHASPHQARSAGRGRRLARLHRRARPAALERHHQARAQAHPGAGEGGLAAGKRAAAEAEEDLDREVREAFRPPGGRRVAAATLGGRMTTSEIRRAFLDYFERAAASGDPLGVRSCPTTTTPRCCSRSPGCSP